MYTLHMQSVLYNLRIADICYEYAGYSSFWSWLTFINIIQLHPIYGCVVYVSIFIVHYTQEIERADDIGEENVERYIYCQRYIVGASLRIGIFYLTIPCHWTLFKISTSPKTIDNIKSHQFVGPHSRINLWFDIKQRIFCSQLTSNF